MPASLQGCVSVTEPASRPSYVADEPDSVFYVLSACLPFNFIFPGFESASGQNIRRCSRNQFCLCYICEKRC